jgi:hypothetical protein
MPFAFVDPVPLGRDGLALSAPGVDEKDEDREHVRRVGARGLEEALELVRAPHAHAAVSSHGELLDLEGRNREPERASPVQDRSEHAELVVYA